MLEVGLVCASVVTCGGSVFFKRTAIRSRVNKNLCICSKSTASPKSRVRPIMGTASLGTAGIWAEFRHIQSHIIETRRLEQ